MDNKEVEIDFAEIDRAIERHKARKEVEGKIGKEVEKKSVAKKTAKKAVKKPAKKPNPNIEKEDKGEIISVKINPKNAEPKPNPKIGKFMDFTDNPKPEVAAAVNIQNNEIEPGEPLIDDEELALLDDKLQVVDDEPESPDDDELQVVAIEKTTETVIVSGNTNLADVADALRNLNFDGVDAVKITEPAEDGIVSEIESEYEPELESEPELDPAAETIDVKMQPATVGDAIDAMNKESDEPEFDGLDEIVAMAPDMDTENDFIDDNFGIDDLPIDSLEQPKFLDKVVVEKRPLGGGDAVEREIYMRELLMAEGNMPSEIAAEEESVGQTAADITPENLKQKKVKKPIFKDNFKTKPNKPKSSVGFYVVLILLLVILACTTGALLYLSGII